MDNVNINGISNFADISNCQLEGLLNGNDKKQGNDKEEKKVCPECNNSEFTTDTGKGEILCLCGQVIEDDLFDTGMEERIYDGDDDGQQRCGMVYNRLLPQSSLGINNSARGRLQKLQRWCAMPYKERSNNIMFKKISEVCTTNHIVKKIELDAKIICKQFSDTRHTSGKNKGKPIITRGFNRAGIVAGCLLIACRRNGETRSIKEIASYFDIQERDVNKGIRSLLAILKDADIVKEIGTSRVTHFVKRKCDEMQIKNKYAEIAIIIAGNIEKLNIASNHTTYSQAAASILLMANINNINSITKRRLSKAFNDLSDVTIMKTYKQLEKYRSLLVNNEKIYEIVQDINNKSRKRVITKEIYTEMRRFGVDTSKYIVEGFEDEHEIIEKHKYDIMEQEYSDLESCCTVNTSELNIYADELSQSSENSGEIYEYQNQSLKRDIEGLKYLGVTDSSIDEMIEIFTDISVRADILSAYLRERAQELSDS